MKSIMRKDFSSLINKPGALVSILHEGLIHYMRHKMHNLKKFLRAAPIVLPLFCSADAGAHHSFAMYDSNQTYVMTGIVTRVDPNPNHLQIFFAPLNEARDQVLKDAKGEPIVWAVEMDTAA